MQLKLYLWLFFLCLFAIPITGAARPDDNVANNQANHRSINISRIPDAATRLGASVVDDWLYVYGGSSGNFRQYSIDVQHNELWRRKLVNEGTWQKVTDGFGRESMGMVSYDGSLYIVGGLTATNQADESINANSVADVWRYDTGLGLPKCRTAHVGRGHCCAGPR